MNNFLVLQTTINDIQQQMNDHYAKNQKLREENVELANKLKSLIEQYELREKVMAATPSLAIFTLKYGTFCLEQYDLHLCY